LGLDSEIQKECKESMCSAVCTGRDRNGLGTDVKTKRFGYFFPPLKMACFEYCTICFGHVHCIYNEVRQVQMTFIVSMLFLYPFKMLTLCQLFFKIPNSFNNPLSSI